MPFVEIVVGLPPEPEPAKPERTLSVNRPLSEEERRLAVVLPDPDRRPRTRGDCLPGGWNAARPCPFASCKYHLAGDVTEVGSLVRTHPEREVADLPDTCALDVADAGEHTLEEIAVHLGVVRERVRQIEEEALLKLRHALARRARKHGGSLDDFRPPEPPPGETLP